ncbi:MAG: hypothetical protein NTW74_17890 [Acidobacteria bacterium]|nr:hypothetical protein [Acidobacteriota bacterium]
MDINHGSILIDATNASGARITGAKANFLLYNHRLRSLDSAFRVKLAGSPILLTDVPAFPYGSAEIVMDIEPPQSPRKGRLTRHHRPYPEHH